MARANWQTTPGGRWRLLGLVRLAKLCGLPGVWRGNGRFTGGEIVFSRLHGLLSLPDESTLVVIWQRFRSTG